jgi:hypothetical protein
MAKNKYRVTDEKIELIFKLYPITKNQRMVAKAVDLSQGTVNRILAARMIEQNKIAEEQKSRMFDIDKYAETITTI